MRSHSKNIFRDIIPSFHISCSSKKPLFIIYVMFHQRKISIYILPEQMFIPYFTYNHTHSMIFILALVNVCVVIDTFHDSIFMNVSIHVS